MISKIKYYTAFILVFLFNIPVYAAPNGANVVYGDVNISQSGSNTVINQNTDKAIINWNSFDVNKGESVLFNQNSSSSIILNRVTSGLPTNIFGNISANGNVFILNQAGVLVGNGAQINTNSFLAGAASINDKDFLAGKHNFYGAQGNVINNGSIKVQDGGYAVLMGKKVENNSNLLTLDSSFLGNKKADKYIFETNGNINVDLGSMSKDLLQSGVELISRNGAITSISDISAMYFSANALNDINVTSYLLGGISLESASGSINYTHKAGPISIKALKALNGNINVNLVGTSGGSSIPGVTLPPDFNIGDLYIFGLESKNPVNITTQNANVISIAGNGATALTLNITNNNTNPYKLEISNNYNITLNTSNTQFSEIKLSSNNGNLYFPVTNNTLTAVDKIYLSANHINGDSKNLKLLAKDVYVNQKSGSNSFIIDAERADINGSELYITFVKDTQLADINKDDYAVSGGSINIMSDYDVIQQNKVYASNVNIAADSFTFDSIDSSVIHGNNISINAKGDISGYGKIIADKVYLSGSTISSASNLLVLADYGHFISTAVNKPANDILININSDDWFDNLKSYKFETYGNGLSYLNGKLVDYKIYDMVKNVYTRNLQPIENTNIDKVTGDDLIKGGRLQDTSELVTIEDNKTPKVNNITKKNKSIELK